MDNSTKQMLEKRQKKQSVTQELRPYLVSFAMMVILTILAFVAVASDSISSKFAPLLILLLAVIQAAFQMFYFMHLKDKGHRFAIGFMASGAVVAVLTVASLMSLIWHPH